MGVSARDEARYVPVETVGVWAWQVDTGHLEELSECMGILQDYGYRLTINAMIASGMLAVVDGVGQAQSVGHLDWIVFENGEVKTVAQQAFVKGYKKFKQASDSSEK